MVEGPRIQAHNIPRQVSFKDANIGRDQSLYQSSLNAPDLFKAHAIIPHLEVPEGGSLKDIGSGTGRVTEILAHHFSRARVYGLDLSHELLEVAERDRMLMHPVYGNACEQLFPDNSLDATCSSTCIHEILSFEGRTGLQRAMEVTFRELKPGGVLVIRDMVIPDGAEPVYLYLPDDDRRQPSSSDKELLSEVEQLSTLELFKKFHRDFGGGAAFDYVIESVEGREFIKVAPEWAYEFYMRKDYRRNYQNEIHEKYGPWTAAQAHHLLEDTGFCDISLHVEHNEWIIQNRLEGQVSLHQPDRHGILQKIPFPPTHLTIVARKPDAPAKRASLASFSLFDAREAIKDVQINREQGVLAVGNVRFSIDPDIAQGTKRTVFYRRDPAGTVIKIPRVDSENPHNAFKAMYQTIERQQVLTEYGVPHLKIVDYDRSGPPYRFIEQERLPENARCAADLILSGELEESDVQQIAELVNRFELEGVWQLDTNPYNWYRLTEPSGETRMVYADGKVYPYDEEWAFTRKGLLQWLMPELLPGPSNELEHRCAQIPRDLLSRDTALWWNSERPMVNWWRNFLDRRLTAVL